MDQLRVKICGLTRAVDVDHALAAGADALGFVHYEPSPRHLTAAQVRALADAVPGSVLTVGVLVDATRAFAAEWIAATGLRAVQLCGREAPGDFVDFPVPILRRVPVDPLGARSIEDWKGIASSFVLDHPRSPGGSGQGVDLELARALASGAPCVLAGGLDASNVAQRVAHVAPHAVDASSRLESAPGIKAAAVLHAFVHAARAALNDSIPSFPRHGRQT